MNKSSRFSHTFGIWLMNNKTFEAQGIWLNMRLTLGLTFFPYLFTSGV